jgi:biopolymer transport protein ExbB/TolQ
VRGNFLFLAHRLRVSLPKKAARGEIVFILQAFKDGGPFMFVIATFGLFAAAFILERYSFLYLRYKETPEGFLQGIREALLRGDFAQAERWALQTQTPLSKIVARGCQVLQRGGSEEEVQARMDEELSKSLSVIDRRTAFLSMFGNVATLVGLLGTITGMIHSFAAVAQANPMDRATLLSKGIAEAMNCTAFGLIVAVPALVTFAIFQNKTDHIVQDLTQKTAEIYHDLVFFFDRGSARARPAHRPEVTL